MDAGAAARIAAAVVEGSPPGEPFAVLEIGAGTGTLTKALADRGVTVLALDLDPAMVDILRKRALPGVSIEQADALRFDYARFAGRYWRATGNLPYNIATPLMLQLLDMRDGPQQLIFMIQKDVAERLIAKPGTSAYGSLSVAVQYLAKVERLFKLGPSVFYPRPKVDSTVVRLRRLQTPAVTPRDVEFFKQVVRGAFAYRRKTLANSVSLSLRVDRARVVAALESLHYNPEIRGEQLDLVQFAALSDRLGE
ncbi:MAG: ribosomal RNA small subunit methyltransferase A [Candidatus Meridianibacter frigidus]|nr:MAG: ribosomal RNA small subunit methyltransferase A [Candidatus Eremiobacteraeota bacterium]